MDQKPVVTRLSVAASTVEAFARATGDISPLHVDAAYARQTSFGEPVVHGVLGVLLALATGLRRPDSTLSAVRARFPRPLLRDQEYTVQTESTEATSVIRVLDGDHVMLTVDAEFTPGRPAPSSYPQGTVGGVEVAAAFSLAEVVQGGQWGDEYQPGWDELRRLTEELRLEPCGVGVAHVAVLSWASYLAGMRMPGRPALVSGIDVRFDNATETDGFAAVAAVTAIDTGFRRITLAGEATAGPLRADVEVTTFVRRETTTPSPDRIASLLSDEQDLHGKVVLVTGGSRGLGAALVQAFALVGCTVYAAFQHSRDAADAMVAGLGADGERVRLVQGDVGDVGWCAEVRAQILREHGRLDFLVLNAGPPLRSLGDGPAFAERSAEHVRRAVTMAQAPLTTFTADVAANQGWLIAISSAAVRTPVPGWAHYVTAKEAVEELLHAEATRHSAARVLIARPPRLNTTFVDALGSADDGLSVEQVAAVIVRRVSGRAEPGQVEVLADFPEPTSERAKLAVAGTFTTDPIRDVLEHWSRQLGLGLAVELTGYNQVFQQLLDPSSTFAANRRGCNVLLVRMDDWPAGEEGVTCVDDFVDAAKRHGERARVPLLVAVCPTAPQPSTARADQLTAMENRLLDGLDGASGVLVVGLDRWSAGYPVAGYYDAARDELAHIPYTPEAYTALGTAVARGVHSLLTPPFKVLVLDCDNTLWRGVCGEDGPEGVAVGEPQRRLQEWAVAAQQRGVLLCLCSKNSEADVDEVFRRGPGMPLRPEHIAARRINWESKADNLAALANELNLGLDSFVFLDDNPVEVAEVAAAHPQVLALTLPTEQSRIPGFLDRLWAFDRPVVTEEDRQRTSSYRAGKARGEARRAAATFADFVEGLRLRIDVHEAEPGQFARISQLTQRTNQFNLSTVRRTEAELREAVAGGARCWVAEVGDRFGEYGLVGVLITRSGHDAVEIETLLLSCRVLGRGVEHAFVAVVAAAEAARSPHETLHVVHRPTPSNTPVRKFCDEVFGEGTQNDDGSTSYRVPLAHAVAIAFQPGEDQAEPEHPRTPSKPVTTEHGRRLAVLASLCEQADLTMLHGSIERSAPPRPPERVGTRPASVLADGTSRLDAVRDVLAEMLRLAPGDLRADTTLEWLRLTSLEIVDATVALERRFGPLPRTLFFEHRTLGALADALPGTADEPVVTTTPVAVVRDEPATSADGIAVVGLAGRYPGAADVAELWQNLIEGVDSVVDVDGRWPRTGQQAGHHAGLIDGVKEFDSLFFGIAPSEAETMDPQQRLFLQTAYAAMQDAGHTPTGLGRDVGVYVGAMSPDYLILSAEAALDGRSRFPNSDLYQIANRVSYFCDFTGPSITVDTACSASGVALQLACDAIRQGTITAAIAGGVNLLLHPSRLLQYGEVGMLSPTGRCRPFGSDADGIVLGEGVGAVLLRPLRDALADGDQIYGVIKAVGVNGDGRTNGFTVPSPDAQAALTERTLRQAGFDPATIGYVEAHGTGTPLGDPIEIRGLSMALGTPGPDSRHPVGSLKGNVGHLVSAAAIASLTKVLLQLKHGRLVPSLHADQLNPHIDFAATSLRVQREAADWTRPPNQPRRGVINSFGAGGVNVHIAVEEGPEPASRAGVEGPELILLSARDADDLRRTCSLLAAHLRGAGEPLSLADIAFTLREGREVFASRTAFVVSERHQLLEELDRRANETAPVAGNALADVFDGSPEMAEILTGLARRGDLVRLGQLWTQGARIDWARVLPRAGQCRVSLPTYPFRPVPHWLPDAPAAQENADAVGEQPVVLYRPVWRAHQAPAAGDPAAEVVVLGAGTTWPGTTPADPCRLPEGDHPLIVVDPRPLEAPDGSVPVALDTAADLARSTSGRYVTYASVCRPESQDPTSASVSGFGRALEHETSSFHTVRIEVPDEMPLLEDIIAAAASGAREIRIDGTGVLRRTWEPVAATGSVPVFRPGGHYVITGGSGRLGRLIADELVRRHRAHVILIGRSAPSGVEDRHDVLALAADVTDRASLSAALDVARERFGPLHGVIHAAGLIADGVLRDKPVETVRRVLAPKVTGTRLLDELTKDDELDFFLLMSSVVAALGNVGQTDYAAANRFLDAFACHRDDLVQRGARQGRTVSVLWPLWWDGGMRMPEAARDLAETTLGQVAIDTPAALRALETVVGLDEPVVLVGHGHQDRIIAALDGVTVSRETANAPDSPAVVRQRVLAAVAELAKIPVADIDTTAELGAYGFTSVLFTDLAGRINRLFGIAVTPVLFFENPTVDALVSALVDRRVAAPAPVRTREPEPAPGPMPVAVIGMAGRFPGSPDLDTFWRNLLDGRCLTGEAPPGRLDGGNWYGGFLEDITAFDAGFFGVSPREARLMDPQQRLFLETGWHAIEDAGYDPRALAGSKTGVFAGASLYDYAQLLSEHGEPVAGHTVTGNMHSIIANRLSSLLDLRGPSEVVDTACASSLTALHRAVGSVRSGECDIAVAGGVNALLSPRWFESLGDAGALSATGRCWTFDDRADGFVRSEGVGAVVLKRLDRALADGDTIRAVIRGTAVNHGGRAHSLTAPNPDGQADVVVAALREAGVDPRTVTYIETHGTGTRLGDPIEVAGLKAAFARLGAPVAEPWCGLGAVKSNVGHLEPAAGVCGLVKVLLALRHRVLPANAAGAVPNSQLALVGSPFSLLTEQRSWQPVDVDGKALPLRAGISSFGFGGANAHVVLEEAPPVGVSSDADVPDLVVLSAADVDGLRAYVRDLAELLSTTPDSLADLAYTSRAGRAAMAVRLAAVADSKARLRELLTDYLGGGSPAGLHVSGAPGRETGELHDVARRWVAGEPVDWSTWPGRRRVPFPVYPFDHRIAHGFAGAPTGTAPTSSAARPQLFRRTWEPAPTRERAGDRETTCLLLAGHELDMALLEDLPHTAGRNWVLLREATPLPAVTGHEYAVDFDDHDAGRRVAEEIVRRHGPIDEVIDLLDVADQHRPAREAARVGLLQVLARTARAHDVRIVHLARETGMAGARMAALVRGVGAEYSGVLTTTVQLDVDVADGLANHLTIAFRELATDPAQPEIRYRAGTRYAAGLSPMPSPATGDPTSLGRFPVDPRRVYLITGGTGGIGLAAAELLVQRGARRIALTGRRPLPPRHEWETPAPGDWWADRVSAIARCEAAGAQVLVHAGSLADRAGLADFLDTVRRNLGPIGGVLHCAGSTPATPAFVDKTFGEIAACWEPKGDGLFVLDDLVRADEPDFFVLFSSVSAVLPPLAAGLTDYASANALLDAFAAHRRTSRTRYLAVDWGSWTGLGMGEVTSPRYRALGLGALTREDGLALLDAAMAVTGETSVVAVAGSPVEAEPAPAPAPERRPATETGDDDVLRAFTTELTRLLADALLRDAATIGLDDRFADLGVDSILIAGVVAKLDGITGAPIEPSVILEHSSVAALASHLVAHHGDGIGRWVARNEPEGAVTVAPPAAARPTMEPVAIIGMAGRFPGAPDLDEYWKLLRDGRSGVGLVPHSRWDVATLYSPSGEEGTSISKWGGFLEGIEDFDPGYFGIPAEDAAHMDPLIRLFLECAANTFADGGFIREELAGKRVGIYVGAGTSTYGSRIPVPGRATATGLNQNFIGAQLAHVYDLRGPNLVVDTACSSSLTSVHLAQQALQTGECDLALAGGADLILDETPYLRLTAARALSPDGACHVFDASANGFVPGEGIGAVLLKRLDRALADGDRVHAVLEAVATNNDGRTMGLTTPNPEAQQEVVLDALAKAGVDATTLSYVEAHGTGTMIGDPIELKALTAVFERFTDERGFCAVGSVKSNIGHLLMAAGMASLHKVVLALGRRTLPPTIHCEQPNPRFVFADSPFYPQVEGAEWRPRHGVRRAGISAFGFGGTNCHAIVRELTDRERETYPVRREPLPAPRFTRTRHWVERPGTTTVTRPRPILELGELT